MTSQSSKRLRKRLRTLPERALPEAARQFFVLKLKSVKEHETAQQHIDDWCFEFLGLLDDNMNGVLILLNQELRRAATGDPQTIGDAASRFLEDAFGLEPQVGGFLEDTVFGLES